MSAAVMARATPSIEERVAALDWGRVTDDLDARGFACTGALLDPDECRALAASYDDAHAAATFRSRVVMSRFGFGRGEYRYFAYPLPDLVGRLRRAAYPRLAPIARAWAARTGERLAFPDRHQDFIDTCAQAGQLRPTPLLLRYVAGDYNCLHQDLYGAVVFPLQLAVLLSEPGEDFDGGEFVMTEQRPRMQSRVEVVPLRRGEAVVFAVNKRPVRGARGDYRVTMRHGVSRLARGERFTVGVIFHDAS